MDDLRAAARELIDRHGPEAVRIAEERAVQQERVGNWPAHSLALRLLTEVERLVAEQA